MQHDPTAAAIALKVERAFAEIRQPNKGGYVTHSCDECEDLEERLHGRHWSDLDLETIVSVRNQLPLLSHGAFRFFLPGLIIASLRYYSETDTLTAAVLSELLRGRSAVLESAQLMAVAEYARYVATVHGNDFPDGLPAEVATTLV